uniref:Uncharacterized protein n=1 Tax=Glossina brevipalpis TaxID=37001 RepID=A0A1A9WMY5_9MUSC
MNTFLVGRSSSSSDSSEHSIDEPIPTSSFSSELSLGKSSVGDGEVVGGLQTGTAISCSGFLISSVTSVVVIVSVRTVVTTKIFVIFELILILIKIQLLSILFSLLMASVSERVHATLQYGDRLKLQIDLRSILFRVY